MQEKFTKFNIKKIVEKNNMKARKHLARAVPLMSFYELCVLLFNQITVFTFFSHFPLVQPKCKKVNGTNATGL